VERDKNQIYEVTKPHGPKPGQAMSFSQHLVEAPLAGDEQAAVEAHSVGISHAGKEVAYYSPAV